MRIRTLAFVAATTAAVAFTVSAQESAPSTPPVQDAMPPAAESPAAPASATTGAKLEAGAQVTDAAGGEIGAIQSVTEGTGGQTVIVQIDGQLYSLPASTLSTASGKIVSRNTKDQITAASKPTP
ncbi:MAG: hypothetical protein Q7J28_02570 [Caulobacter sp.]|nr:hypothetical protein [Caulobacter sp.]